jgi:hypothetical protein
VEELAIDADVVAGSVVACAEGVDDCSVDLDTAFENDLLGLAAAGDAGLGEDLLEAVAFWGIVRFRFGGKRLGHFLVFLTAEKIVAVGTSNLYYRLFQQGWRRLRERFILAARLALAPYSELIGVDRRSALETFGSGLEWSIGQSFTVTFGSGYCVRLVVLRAVGGVAWVGFGIEL